MRKAPPEHAKEFDLGERRIGNDNEMWEIIQTKKGVKRWKKVNIQTRIIKAHLTRSQPSFTRKIGRKVKKRKKTRKNSLTLKKMKALMKKYNVVGANTKHDIAETLYRVRSNSLLTKDIKAILPFLERKQRKLANKLIQERKDHPITDYKGMWKLQPKSLNQMSHNELISHLRSFKKAWERETTRNQDIDFEGSDASLRQNLKYYYSKGAKLQAADWLRNN